MESLGQPAYRARQISQWVWQRGVCDWQAMSDLPAQLRGDLAKRLRVLSGGVVARTDAADGVVKLLIRWSDGEQVETALIPSERRVTACLSTQAGCAMGCQFCASGLEGLKRNLTAGEMLEQVLHLRQAAGRRITHVVFMGVGEPLANYEATLAAIRGIIDPQRLGVSARHVTVSTIGLPRQVRRLAREGLPITLAVSLHAPNDALRRQIMPAAGKAPIAEVVAAAEEFFHSRGREVTLEYVLLGGLNDSALCGEALARIARRMRCNVNLIRYNPVELLPYHRPSQAAVAGFADRLRRRGVNVQVRRSRGLGADAACGQLRLRTETHG
jgi:23S rRNA (adenine2503-C2)-methyltransferase